MAYEPVYAGAAPAGALEITPAKQQLIGVQFEPVELTAGTEIVRAVARVGYDQKEFLLIADVMEHEAGKIRLGQAAVVWRPSETSRRFSTRVDYIYPRLDSVTRTLKVRLNGGETGLGILPESYMNAEFHISGPPALSVSADAVLDTGTRQQVFVKREEGVLEPRLIVTGRRLAGNRVEVLAGLKRGDNVVTSANFLIDSESRTRGLTPQPLATPMRPAAAASISQPVAMAAPSRFVGAARNRSSARHIDPVCGKEIEEMQAVARTVEYRGQVMYFCSDECRKQFAVNPELYGQRLLGPAMPAETAPGFEVVGPPQNHSMPISK